MSLLMFHALMMLLQLDLFFFFLKLCTSIFLLFQQCIPECPFLILSAAFVLFTLCLLLFLNFELI